MTGVVAALAIGAAGTVIAYVALTEIDAFRNGRQARSLVGVAHRSRRVPELDLRAMWARARSGELPLRAVQLLAAGTVLLFALGLVLRSLGLSLVAALLGIAVGYAWTQRQRWTLAARIEAQLPETISLIASALSAGGTLFQALEAASRDTPAPLGPLLREAVGRAELVRTVEESLRDLRDQVGSRDLDDLVAALAIQRATGGDLARLLREAVTFLREEQRLRADARALSAQARYSAQIIGVLPFALFLAFSAFFPGFVAPLTDTRIGIAILSYCLVSAAAGFYVISRIANGIERV